MSQQEESNETPLTADELSRLIERPLPLPGPDVMRLFATIAALRTQLEQAQAVHEAQQEDIIDREIMYAETFAKLTQAEARETALSEALEKAQAQEEAARRAMRAAWTRETALREAQKINMDKFQVRHCINTLLYEERQHQDNLKASGKFTKTCADDMTQEMRLAVLMEEVGELAHEINEGRGDSKEAQKELIQVGAVVIAWLESYTNYNLHDYKVTLK